MRNIGMTVTVRGIRELERSLTSVMDRLEELEPNPLPFLASEVGIHFRSGLPALGTMRRTEQVYGAAFMAFQNYILRQLGEFDDS